MPQASSMCARRYGKDGLKITAHQLAAMMPFGESTCPAGVCIHELSARIQNADTMVPSATMMLEATCHATRDAVHAEEHDAEERRLEEKRGEHLVGEQRPGDVPTWFM